MKTRTLAWLALLLAAAAGGLYWALAPGEQKADKYVTAPVERGDIESTVSAIGNLQPLQYVDVGTQVTGQLKLLHAAIGDTVKEGQLVAEIDPTVFESRVEATRATIANLEAQLAERRAEQRLAQQRLKRAKQLISSDAVSEEQLQVAAAAADQAAAQVAALAAQVEQSRSQMKADQANLRYTKIYAPMSGTVVSITARQGQTLVSSQQAPVILRIADLDTMTVWAQVSEADVPKIRVAMPVYFNTLGQPERRWQGKVRQLLPTPETVNNVVLYNVLFDVDNPDRALQTQMSAQVYFLLDRVENVLTVPTAALHPLAKGGKEPRGERAGGGGRAQAAEGQGKAKPKIHMVRVLKDGRIEEREVQVGLATRLKAEVLSGLAEGEQVVVGVAAEKGKDAAQSRTLPRPGRPF
jgi:macrolide-specific efflux system membrane fusion protein